MFGQTRLAVIDLSSAAQQPMVRDSLAITFNGEIYNYRDIRDELQQLGHTFTTQSDTEVLLVGWHAWGAALLPRLIGMFAFALWDPRAGELVLVRDRFGKKPLLFTHSGARISFASDLIALQDIDGQQRQINPSALRLLFTLRYIPDPLTIASGVEKLPAGHLARFSARGISIQRWYDLASARPPRYRSEIEAIEDLKPRFDAAVAARTVADVPIGAFLSGGIDSALVAASLAVQGHEVRTFTVGFPGASDYYEERPAARAVAEYLGTTHTEIAVTPAEALGAIPDLLENQDEPFADSSALPTYLLSQATRRHVTVALSGDGADEVFGGYRKYQGELYAASYGLVPHWLRRHIIEPIVTCLPEDKDYPLLERARRLKRFVAHAGKPPAARQAGWARLLSEAQLDAFIRPSSKGPTVEALVESARAAARESDAINEMLSAEMALGLVGDMLVKVDRMSMAHGLEVRCPWLDQRVVECAAAMPGAYKLARGAGKRILRHAFKDRLPDAVFDRPKRGFEMPIAQWLRADLSDLVRRAIDPVRLARDGLFRPELPKRWHDDLMSGRRDTSWELWTLIVFQGWNERHARLEAAA
jgi:asparagine synthase (glutamine-hydrolysing)